MGKYVLGRHFDGEVQKKAIFAHLIDCHDPARTVSREPSIHSGSFNSAEQFPSIFFSIRSIVQQKVDEINSVTFDLYTSRVFTRNDRWIFISRSLHCVAKLQFLQYSLGFMFPSCGQ